MSVGPALRLCQGLSGRERTTCGGRWGRENDACAKTEGSPGEFPENRATKYVTERVRNRVMNRVTSRVTRASRGRGDLERCRRLVGRGGEVRVDVEETADA